MQKYILVRWPDIQDYMERPDFVEGMYFCPTENVWFIPEDWHNFVDISVLENNIE